MMPRGARYKAEMMPRAAELREQGLNWVQIATELGLGRSTVHAWFSDPDLLKQKERRLRYGQPCVDCGQQTDGSGGFANPSQRCIRCALRWQSENAIWTDQTIITAIQAWVEENGKIPSAADWNPPLAIAIGHPEKAEKFHDDDAWPWVAVVQRRFGSWNAAIAAAGYEPRATGERDSERCIDLEAAREVRDYYEAGHSATETGAEFGITHGTVSRWVYAAGGRMRTLREAQILSWDHRRQKAAA